MSKILVTGSTGNVGSRLVSLLVSQGQQVRALVRNTDKAKFGPGVEVVTGDFNDSASLRQALSGVSKMFLLAAGPDLERYEANAIDAAKAQGIELLVKQSVAGAQYKATDIPRWHRAGEERIEASGISYAFIRPAAFASNALYWTDTIKSHDTVYGALAEASLPVIDPEDIAAVAAHVLVTPGSAGKAYEITGPESITTQQQVDTLSEVLGRRLKYVNVPDEAARQSMAGMGMDPRYVNAMVGLIQTLRGFGRIEPTTEVKNLLGRQPRSFRQWADANIGAFAEAAQTHA